MLNTNCSLDNNPIKWKIPLLARVICGFDIILTNFKADVTISQDSHSQEIVMFEEYTESAR